MTESPYTNPVTAALLAGIALAPDDPHFAAELVHAAKRRQYLDAVPGDIRETAAAAHDIADWGRQFKALVDRIALYSDLPRIAMEESPAMHANRRFAARAAMTLRSYPVDRALSEVLRSFEALLAAVESEAKRHR